MKFQKLQGLGNNFVLSDNRDGKITKREDLAVEICNMDTGIGADGLILVESPGSGDFDTKMRIFNPDGSEPEMCGNGIRCFAKYVKDNGLFSPDRLKIETLAGPIITQLTRNSDKLAQVRVDMGPPVFEGKDFSGKEKEAVSLEGHDFLYVSMGNPHAITLVDNYDFKYRETGRKVETNEKVFPARTNVEFIHVRGKSEIDMRVWERGVGETKACGTGACASVVAGTLLGKLDKGPVIVHLLGGDLIIEWGEDNHVLMTGPAELVFEGEYYEN